MQLHEDPEVIEHVREILKMTTTYIDDVAIHLGSNPPNTMVSLRMGLAKQGLDILDDQVPGGEFAPMRSAVLSSQRLKAKFTELRSRFNGLNKQIKEYRFDPIV